MNESHCVLPDNRPIHQQPIVLDTNIWLDLLVFSQGRQARAAAVRMHQTFAAQVCDRGVPIAICEPALEELADVLTRDQFGLDQSQIQTAMQSARAMTTCFPLSSTTSCRLRCQDPDDQKFLELATAIGASALLTRDKALIKLARAAQHHYELFIGDFDKWVMAGNQP